MLQRAQTVLSLAQLLPLHTMPDFLFDKDHEPSRDWILKSSHFEKEEFQIQIQLTTSNHHVAIVRDTVKISKSMHDSLRPIGVILFSIPERYKGKVSLETSGTTTSMRVYCHQVQIHVTKPSLRGMCVYRLYFGYGYGGGGSSTSGESINQDALIDIRATLGRDNDGLNGVGF